MRTCGHFLVYSVSFESSNVLISLKISKREEMKMFEGRKTTSIECSDVIKALGRVLKGKEVDRPGGIDIMAEDWPGVVFGTIAFEEDQKYRDSFVSVIFRASPGGIVSATMSGTVVTRGPDLEVLKFENLNVAAAPDCEEKVIILSALNSLLKTVVGNKTRNLGIESDELGRWKNLRFV